ncbi:MAG: DNA integrity scanning protein DisA nucleotide-binding domain protein, partial [Desulfosarcina sp.]|nr:DNA integrity scanning protein DisA nucleotide-binding domain protein [Desulfosarcina sp.]
FQKHSPLHDGATLIHNGKVTMAAAFLPLTSQEGLSKALALDTFSLQPVFLNTPRLLMRGSITKRPDATASLYTSQGAWPPSAEFSKMSWTSR